MQNKIIKLFVLFIFVFTNLKLSAQKKPAESQGLEWHTDLMKVYDISQKKKKPVFAFFTGSDWCGWCKKLQADVFAKPEFIAWVKKNVILLEVDFPRGKALSPELTQQNNNLAASFGIMGYPTCWMFNMTKNDSTKKFSIDPVGSLGYPAGSEIGKEQIKFLHTADSLLKIYKGKPKPKS
jgi:thiol-disulfide isomerase/thioredoxin